MSTASTVPALSIAAMAVTLVISFGLPIYLCVRYKRRGAHLRNFFLGCAVFVLFVLVLEQLLHTVVLNRFEIFFTENVFAYALYGGFAAGLFEETGRYLAMRFLMKKTLNKRESLMYGAGHGGIEAMLLVGLTYISNISAAFTINSGAAAALPEELLAQLSPLMVTPSWIFLMGGLERVSAIILHISLSYLVYRAVKDRKPGFYFLALFLHFAVDALTVLLTSFGLNMLVFELLLLAVMALLALRVRRMYAAETEPPADAAPIPEE